MHIQTTFVKVFVPDILQIISINNKTLVKYTFV